MLKECLIFFRCSEQPCIKNNCKPYFSVYSVDPITVVPRTQQDCSTDCLEILGNTQVKSHDPVLPHYKNILTLKFPIFSADPVTVIPRTQQDCSTDY